MRLAIFGEDHRLAFALGLILQRDPGVVQFIFVVDHHQHVVAEVVQQCRGRRIGRAAVAPHTLQRRNQQTIQHLTAALCAGVKQADGLNLIAE